MLSCIKRPYFADGTTKTTVAFQAAAYAAATSYLLHTDDINTFSRRLFKKFGDELALANSAESKPPTGSCPCSYPGFSPEGVPCRGDETLRVAGTLLQDAATDIDGEPGTSRADAKTEPLSQQSESSHRDAVEKDDSSGCFSASFGKTPKHMRTADPRKRKFNVTVEDVEEEQSAQSGASPLEGTTILEDRSAQAASRWSRRLNATVEDVDDESTVPGDSPEGTTILEVRMAKSDPSTTIDPAVAESLERGRRSVKSVFADIRRQGKGGFVEDRDAFTTATSVSEAFGPPPKLTFVPMQDEVKPVPQETPAQPTVSIPTQDSNTGYHPPTLLYATSGGDEDTAPQDLAESLQSIQRRASHRVHKRQLRSRKYQDGLPIERTAPAVRAPNEGKKSVRFAVDTKPPAHSTSQSKQDKLESPAPPKDTALDEFSRALHASNGSLFTKPNDTSEAELIRRLPGQMKNGAGGIAWCVGRDPKGYYVIDSPVHRILLDLGAGVCYSAETGRPMGIEDVYRCVLWNKGEREERWAGLRWKGGTIEEAKYRKLEERYGSREQVAWAAEVERLKKPVDIYAIRSGYRA